DFIVFEKGVVPHGQVFRLKLMYESFVAADVLCFFTQVCLRAGQGRRDRWVTDVYVSINIHA
ncbi:MAG: hypothetical protein ACXVPD_11895, partial [Bacteroidia bacterium]